MKYENSTYFNVSFLILKIYLHIKRTNCTSDEVTYLIKCENGSISNNASSCSDLRVKSKYQKKEKTRTLYMQYKPFDLVVLLNKNRVGKNLSISLHYPESRDTKDRRKMSICEPITSEVAFSTSTFEKLNLSDQCRGTYMFNSSLSGNLERITDSLAKRKCKFENLVEALESGEHNITDLARLRSAQFKEISLASVDLVNVRSLLVDNSAEKKLESKSYDTNEISDEDNYFYSYNYDSNQTAKKQLEFETSSGLRFSFTGFIFIFKLNQC